MNSKLPKVLVGVLLVAILVDVAYLHWRLTVTETTSSIGKITAAIEDDGSALVRQDSPQAGVEENAACSSGCLDLIRDEVARAVATISGQETAVEKTTETVTQQQAVTLPSTPRISYFPLGSGGESVNTEWTWVQGTNFVFDLSDYNAGAVVTWEANLRAEHANSRCYARIWDVSNLRGVDFSEQTTDSTSSVNLISLPLSVWQGKNDYYLELKSLNGIRCYLSSPRLKIVD